MIKVANRRCVGRLARRSLRANRIRNAIAILAIALTTVLFTSLFTIALSINYSFQQSNFRQVGGWSHGGFKYLTEAQFEELREDPLIREWGLRRFVGMPADEPFQKSHVEIGYSDANQAHWMYCDPEEGRLPEEGTDEAATDTRVLELLGVEPEVGNQFTVTFLVDNRETTQTFTLCGWWEYDEAIVANHILIPESRVDDILDEVGVVPPGSDGMTGSWDLDVMFRNSMHIAQDMDQVLENHGYQGISRTEGDNYINTGVNWGYTGAQLADSMDPTTLAAVAALLLLIIFTGYLIIYNVFQISVTNDIRFYGLLKTIGTTGKQLKRIIRRQALTLSLAGIPLGLLLGYGVGAWLTPVVLRRLDGVVEDALSASPLIFVGSALFSLITVLISCRKPGRMASRVSPIEAIRYTEHDGGKKRQGRKTTRGINLLSMAYGNLGRSRRKTVVTILSLCLAIVLLNVTVTFTNGFDMEKYVSRSTVSDFLVADAGQFQTGGDLFYDEMAVPQSVVDAIAAQGGVTDGGKVYGRTSPVQEFVTESYFREVNSGWNSQEMLDSMVHFMDRNEDGLLADTAQLYGMERFALDKLGVLEGDLSKLYEPGGRYVAAVYADDDYGNPNMDSHWARLGDRITLRYVEEYEYYNPDTGEVYEGEVPEGEPFVARAARYRDIEYEVAALVTVPYALSYRYYGSDEFVMNDQTFRQDTGTDCVMAYAFDTTEEGNAGMEQFLADFTQNQQPQWDYESKATYSAEFESFRSMFLLLGSVLSMIVGLVGILNFFNAVMTSIITRRREFAMLQSIGMTGRQLRRMLVWEGMLYALISLAASLLISLLGSLLLSSVLERVFWFFTYRLTLLPILICTPVLLLIAAAVPSGCYSRLARQSVVERLRESE